MLLKHCQIFLTLYQTPFKMFRKIIFSILTLSFISCESYRKSEVVSANTALPVEEVSFTEYSGKIKPISLPLRAKCEEALSGSKFGFNESAISKFGQENA